MDPAEAVKVTQDPDELQDLCDDNLQEPAPEPSPDLSTELTKDIQRSRQHRVPVVSDNM